MNLQAGRERRMSDRIPTSIAMQVYAYGMRVANGVAVEMSAHGLQIRIHQDFSDDELDPGRHLDVMLDSMEVTPSERWMPIRVVRKWEEGIAARFIGVGMESIRPC
jgi:hypothetical protein